MSRLTGSRKGFELQFNWMFVLIAGAIFLVFFFLIIRGQVSSSEEDEALKSQADLDFIMRSSQGSRDSEKRISFGSRIGFACSDGISLYSVPNSRLSEDYNYVVLFSPPFVDAPELLLKTASLKAPFSAASVSYLTTAQASYVFLDDGLQSRHLFASLPGNSTRAFHLAPLGGLGDDNFDHTILVFDSTAVNANDVLGSSLGFFKPNRHDSILLVEYQPNGGVKGSYGTVRFYRYSGSGFSQVAESYYFSEAQLLGAVYSGSFELYSCQSEKIKSRIALLSELYSRRATYFSSQHPACSQIYADASAELGALKNASQEALSFASSQKIFESVQRLQAINYAIVDKTSCPLIY